MLGPGMGRLLAVLLPKGETWRESRVESVPLVSGLRRAKEVIYRSAGPVGIGRGTV